MIVKNFSGIRNIKPRAGLTLVELVIAVTVLVIAMGGIFTAIHVGFMTSARANDLTGASIEAQLQMESLMGRWWVDPVNPTFSLSTNPGPLGQPWNAPFPSTCGDFVVRLTAVPEGFIGLDIMSITATVFIYNTMDDANDHAADPNDETWIIRQRNIISVIPEIGG